MNFFKNLPPIERKRDGALPRMTLSQRKRANALIRDICCNYYEGNCLLLDHGAGGVCVQSISYTVLCKFFRHVLLKDKAGQALKAELFRDETTKRCAVCGKAFQSKSNSAKYCGSCAKDVQRKQKAAHIRRKRSGVEK